MELVNKLREVTFEWAAQNDISLAFTFVYAKGEDDAWVEKLFSSIQNFGGEVYPVQIVPTHDVLLNRISMPSRQNSSKLTDSNELVKSLEKYNLYGPMKAKNNLVIDNSQLSPASVAQK